jgi:hypothetical protein
MAGKVAMVGVTHPMHAIWSKKALVQPHVKPNRAAAAQGDIAEASSRPAVGYQRYVELTTHAHFFLGDAERQRSPRAQAGPEILLGPGPET